LVSEDAGAARAGNETSESDGAVLVSRLSPEKRLLVKLLYIEDFDLDAADVQQLAQRSGRRVREVIELIEQARESVRTLSGGGQPPPLPHLRGSAHDLAVV